MQSGIGAYLMPESLLISKKMKRLGTNYCRILDPKLDTTWRVRQLVDSTGSGKDDISYIA